mmetsp:Transcript_15611/g.27744  ORF Transcript_15611/g.27744 Transcript_15611/m.27744 type:complete len:392 (-) Transcript_15611:131-1306(-)
MAAADDKDWVSPKKRNLQQPTPLSQYNYYEVSRNSGLVGTKGTFGASERFDRAGKVIGRGKDSPNGKEFYCRNALFKNDYLEAPRMTTQGMGDRPPLHANGAAPKAVGPGSYNIVASCAKRKSPLDGPEYCSMSIAKKLGSSLVPYNLCSPGPHHDYEVRKPSDAHLPNYGLPSLSHGTRHPPPEDTDGPMLKYAHNHTKGLAKSISAPALKSETPQPEAGGSKRFVKSTFGMADRFGKGPRQTSSPTGEMYYAHSKVWTSEDYLQNGKTCGFGASGKTDFSNVYHDHRNDVSPVTYNPISSAAKKTSSFDGLTLRSESTTVAYCRAQGFSTKTAAAFAPAPKAIPKAKAQAGRAKGSSKNASMSAATLDLVPSSPQLTAALSTADLAEAA